MNKWFIGAGSIAILVVLIVLAMAIQKHGEDPLRDEELADRVYRRILGEVWLEVKPLYEEYDLNTRDKPDSFGALLAPFLSRNKDASLSSTHPGQNRAGARSHGGTRGS